MTNSILQSLQRIAVTAAVFFLTGCEKPQSKSDQIVPPNQKTEASSKPGDVKSGGNAGEAKAAQEKKEPEDALLDVKKIDGIIIISGGLKSRIQIGRIEEDLKREFPNLTIQNDLELEFHRFPVGWGNRVSASFLVPYFEQVKNPHIRYEKGIVLLEGEVKNSKTHRQVTELAVGAFMGAYTEDIENKIKVTK